MKVGDAVEVETNGAAWSATITRIDPNWEVGSLGAVNVYVTGPDAHGRCIQGAVLRDGEYRHFDRRYYSRFVIRAA